MKGSTNLKKEVCPKNFFFYKAAVLKNKSLWKSTLQWR